MNRYHVLDEIRGVTLISMILYHACWDAVYILELDWAWYHSAAAYWWQQSIAWTFILLSGFCWQLGKRRLRRGLTVFGAGFLVMVVTAVFTPESRIVFGVLTLIGSSMLLMIPLHKVLRRWGGNPREQGSDPAPAEYGGPGRIGSCMGLGVSGMLFFLTRNVNRGFLGFERLNIVQLPENWYCSRFSTYLGFPDPGFFSTDYFSLIPWFFLFLCGYFFFDIVKRAGLLLSKLHTDAAPRTVRLREKIMAPVGWLGRHSLPVYLLHQPALFAICMVLSTVV